MLMRPGTTDADVAGRGWDEFYFVTPHTSDSVTLVVSSMYGTDTTMFPGIKLIQVYVDTRKS